MSYSLFLTSNLGGYGKNEATGRWGITGLQDDINGLYTLLEERWDGPARCLFITAAPDDEKDTRSYARQIAKILRVSELPVRYMHICDRNHAKRVQHLERYDVIILAGGHLTTQNDYFREIQLETYIRAFNGLILGISAGSMNSAEVVYAAPEEAGEAVDPTYERYRTGLGLTQINILPHFQYMAGQRLDGLRMLEDIFLPDSQNRPYIALPDGSFIVEEDGMAVLFGPAFWVENETLEPIGSREEGFVLGERFIAAANCAK